MNRAPESEGWEHFHHVADVGVRGFGSTEEVAFEQAALAMTAVITDPAAVAAQECVDIACSAMDDEMLLVEWLNALIFEMATRQLLFGRFRVRIAGGAVCRELVGKAWGEPIDRRRHAPAAEVKGATLTALSVRCDGKGRWAAQCVVDV
jgi:tRNA nucleotidyltransferase (CCA-adding enzyme)